MDLQTVSQYPFRHEALEWMGEQGVALSDVLTSPVYERFRQAGLDRVLQSMTEDGIRPVHVHDRDDAILAVLSYPIARMLVSSVGDLVLIRRYALHEAKLAHSFMTKEDTDFLLGMAAEELGVEAETVEDGEETVFQLHFTDYLKNASALRGRPWKLYNQDLQQGHVRLDHRRFARLLQEALRRRIEAELPLEVNDTILEHLNAEIAQVVTGVERLRETIQRESYGEFSIDYMPPCMRTLLAQIRQGVNVPHMGRFALTAFLSHVGLDADDILDLFRGSADFKESIASYQVRHILGDVSGTRYTPPSCATMQTYGICFRDKTCEGVGSPLRYYFRRQRRAERERGREASAGEREEAGDERGDEKGEGKGDEKEEGKVEESEEVREDG